MPRSRRRCTTLSGTSQVQTGRRRCPRASANAGADLAEAGRRFPCAEPPCRREVPWPSRKREPTCRWSGSARAEFGTLGRTAAGGWNQTTLSQGFFAGAPVAADPLLANRLRRRCHRAADCRRLLERRLASLFATARPRLCLAVGAKAGGPQHGFDPGDGLFRQPQPGRTRRANGLSILAPLPPAAVQHPAGGSVPRRISRSGGGTLNEVHLMPGPFGGWVRQIVNLPHPAAARPHAGRVGEARDL